jgi:pimeloyl-ACP methyl ester carboxylesterase
MTCELLVPAENGLVCGIVAAHRDARGAVVLVPGLFATGALFTAAAPGEASFAAALAAAARTRVIRYDPRGLGLNREVHGGAEASLATRARDLGEVLVAVREQVSGPLALVGHSFGGTTIHALLADLAARPAPRHEVAAAAVIASPARLLPHHDGWRDLYSERTLALLDAGVQDGFLGFTAFSSIQHRIYRGFKLPVARWTIAAGTEAARRSRAAAALILALGPLSPRTFVHSPGDFTAAQLHAVLLASAMQRESAALLRELLRAGMDDGALRAGGATAPALPDASRPVATPLLALASPADPLVRPAEVEAIGRGESAVVAPCGHGGYFFKRGVREQVLAALASFLGRHGFA